MHRLLRAFVVVRRRGIRYLFYLLSGYFIPQVEHILLYRLARAQLRLLLLILCSSAIVAVGAILGWWLGTIAALISLACLGLGGYAGLRLYRLICLHQKQKFVDESLKALQTHSGRSFTRWLDYPVAQATRHAVESACSKDGQSEIVIGQIDNDGRVFGSYGPLPYVNNIQQDEFVARYRFLLDIVLLEGHVLVRKDFRGDRNRFINECYNLLQLEGHANTPIIYRLDKQRCIVYKNLIPGHTVRDILANAGANILTVNVQQDPSLQGLSEDQRIYAVWERGKKLLHAAVPETFFTQMENQLDHIHARGMARLSLTFGNIIIGEKDGQPWLVDMEGSKHFRTLGNFLFNYERDRDREKYNQIYGRSILTEHSARQAIATHLRITYAPVDFGRGLATPDFWTTESGSGRWEYLNGRVIGPLVREKRVLDLGANNGIMDLMMLKSGAQSVVALEFSPEYTETARLVHRIFEWRDIQRYDFTIHNCDMRTILTNSYGKFDVITAFCSLYYLEPEDMAAVVRKAAGLVPLIIVQAKTNARPEAGDKGRRSSPEYLSRLLQENGFPKVELIAPKGFMRPLLIGQRQL